MHLRTGHLRISHEAKVPTTFANVNSHCLRYRVLAFTLIACGLFAATHDFHYTRSDWHWNPRSSTWQVTFRIFTDDWEHALESAANNEEPLNLGDENQRADAELLGHSYVLEHIDFQANGTPVTLSWTGMEIDYDITYLYLESSLTEYPNSADIQVDMFREMFDDQANEVVFNVGQVKRGEILTEDLPTWHIQL
jgi:hypothetical protein